MAYQFKTQSDMTDYKFKETAIAQWEGSRNTDPGESNVVDGITYLIHNILKTGTRVVSSIVSFGHFANSLEEE